MSVPNGHRGITLIALVITIIVLLILAAVSIAALTGESGIITQTETAKIATELTEIKERLEIIQLEGQVTEENRKYMTVQEVKNELPNIAEKYDGKIGVYRAEPVYLGEEEEEIAKIAKNYGYRILNMTEDEFKYYIELGIVEDSVTANSNNKVGRELATADFPDTIKIGSNTYSNGWYLIGNYTEEEKNNNTYQNQFEQLGIKDTTHAPYLVNYETRSVFSVNGMIMYLAQIPVHTFQDNNFKLVNAITYVGDTSVKNGSYYGNMYSTSLYQETISPIYSDNNGNLEYDENGALILDKDNAIPVLEVQEKYQINDSYSVNVTVSADSYKEQNSTNNTGKYSLPVTIVALSENSGDYISWIGINKGYLHVYSYRENSVAGVEEELTKEGFASIDISRYEGQPINIQVVAVRGGETKVYINGELIKTFISGSNKFTYKYATIGDLRVGRNLKFTGKVYNFGIYGVALTEEEIQENYEEAKAYLDI